MSIGWPFLLRNHSNKHLTYGKLFWFFILFTWWTFWDHCQQNWNIFTCLTPVEPKIWPLTFFNNYETVRRRQVKLYFFWFVITRGICWCASRQHWSNFWIWSLYKLSCDPQASCTGCDPAAIWNGDPGTHTNIMKLSNLSFLFSWINFGSVRPNMLFTNARRHLFNDILTTVQRISPRKDINKVYELQIAFAFRLF